MRDEGRAYLKQFEDDLSECEDFYEGEHWKNYDPQNRPKNHVFQLIEGEIPVLMDPMPSTDIIVLDERFAEQAEVLDAAKDHVYREQNIFLKDVQAIRDELIVGHGFQYVDYDPDGEGGEGSVILKNLDRKQVVLDPAASEIDQCRYAIIDVPLSNEDLRRRYPKTAEEALSQKMTDTFVFSGTKRGLEDRNIGNTGSNDGRDRYESKDMTFVEECWLRDYSMEKIPDDQTQIELTEESAQLMEGINPDIHKWENHEAHIAGHRDQKVFIVAEALQIQPELVTEQDIERAKEDQEIALRLAIIDDHISMHEMYIENMDSDEIGKRPKYPKNLRLIIKTGKVVHFDGAPDIDDGLIPLVIFYCYKGKLIYGKGAAKHIIPSQKTINEMDAKELRGLKVASNPGWVVDRQSEVDPDTLTDEDGLVIEKEQGTEAYRLTPGQVSPQLEQRSRREYEAMQRIEGVGEAVLGEAPRHQMSGVSLRRLQMQSLGRIRLKSKMIENAIERRDRLILSRIIKKWSTERKLRAYDANGNIRFVKFDPRSIRDISYEVVLSPGTMAGMDNETIAETYKEFLLAGAIDMRTYATLTNLPKKNALLEILDQNDQTKAALEQLQQQNLQLKAQFAPQLLTPEEVAALEQMQAQAQQQAPMAVG